MADLTQTAANVALAAVGATVQIIQAGEALTQGMPAYLNSTDSKYYKSVNSSAPAALARGIALTAASADGYAVIATAGPIDVGATLTVGTTYCVSNTAGAIAPIADIATTGEFVTILGIAITASKLQLNIDASGIAVP